MKLRLYRILFLGDTGVGKSSLIQNLCSYSGSVQSSAYQSLKSTKGFAISCIVLPLSVERETGEHNIVVELWEWGGVVTKSSVLQRALRCIPFDGIVFVYDLTISATRDSLWKFWAVQVRRSFGDLEGGEDNYNTNLFQSQGWKRIVDMLMYVFLQLVCVLPFANTHWKEKMEAYYLYQISRQLPLAVVGTKSDIWSQRRKRRLHKSSPMDGIFYCLWNAEETNQNRSFWNFLHAVLERKTNKTNKQQHG